MNHKRYIAIFAVFIGVSVFVGSVANATHSWNGYHWARTSSPFTLKLGDNVSSAWDAYLGTTSSDWSLSSVLDTTITAGQTNPKNCRAVNGKVQVCNSAYGNNGWLGVAQIWINGSHIVKGAVKLNDTYFNTATYNTPAWRNLVMCQEVGHTLGLDHQDEIFGNANLGTCMDYTSDPSGTLADPDQLSNEHPNVHDYDELAIIYSHIDEFISVRNKKLSASANIDADDIDVSDKKEWGKIVRKSHDERSSLYKRDLSNGEKLFTFVIWAQ